MGEYWQTREFWEANYEHGPAALAQLYPQSPRTTWQNRRENGMRLYPDLLWRGRPVPLAPVLDSVVAPGEVDRAQLLKQLAPGVSVEHLANTFDCSPAKIRLAVDALRSDSLIVYEFGDLLKLGSDLVPSEEPVRVDSARFRESIVPIGVLADTHLCSKYERLDVLDDLFDRFAAAGVKDVYCGGNHIDGEARFNLHDIHVHGCDDQFDYLVAKWPQRKGITTHFISGDDHEGWYVQREHINVGQKLEDHAARAGRVDMRDLGYMERVLEFKQEGGVGRVAIVHAGGGSAYSVSYSAQKWVEALQGGEKPNIAILGHYHKFDVSYPREVLTVQPGCTQDQTPFMRKRKLASHVGGCILHLRQNELGIFTSSAVEWFPYYDRKFYNYKWQKVTLCDD